MANYTKQYESFLKPESRVGKANIKGGNIYRISSYDAITKRGSDSRYIFVLGRVGKKIHCIKIGDVLPNAFTKLIRKLRNKNVEIKDGVRLSDLLKKFDADGSNIFTGYIKNNGAIYSYKLGNYRTYIVDKISYVSEIRFETDFLNELFQEGKMTKGERQDIIDDEVQNTFREDLADED
jgi:hypothetical protein